MRKNQASFTAMGIALLRALESARAEDERICYDPYARTFIPGWFYAFGWFFTSIGYAEWRSPGVQGFLAARERYMDDVLQQALDRGIDQLVILGAGYDSRAYRFDGLKNGVNVFEVDHPATQEEKIKKVKDIFGEVPAHVVYVGVDFNQQSLAECLRSGGYDSTLRTLFIWQGVTYYLTPEAVDSTLELIAHQSGSGSAVVFDFIDRAVLEGSQSHGEVAGMRRYRQMIGEGLVFGIPLDGIEEFMRVRGFDRVKNVGGDDLHHLYFTGTRQKRKVISGYGIVSAFVQT